jgi:hypothetical protein
VKISQGQLKALKKDVAEHRQNAIAWSAENAASVEEAIKSCRWRLHMSVSRIAVLRKLLELSKTPAGRRSHIHYLNRTRREAARLAGELSGYYKATLRG